MDLFFSAVVKQADDRANGCIPDLESYITVRRDTSGCKPCFALIEYAARIDLPDEVMSHPVIMAMEEATNDLVTWSNVSRASPFVRLRRLIRSHRTSFPTTSSNLDTIRTT
jgi:hypothetical protein